MNIALFMIIIVLLFFSLIKLNFYNKRFFLDITILIIVSSLIVGTRKLDSGFDTIHYVTLLEEIKRNLTDGFWSLYETYKYIVPEPIFFLYTYILSILNISPRVYLLVTGFLSFFILYVGIYRYTSKYYVIIILLMVTMSFYFLYSNAIRQGLAFSIAMYGILTYSSDKNKIKYIVISIIAMLTHSSSVIFVLYFFIQIFGIRIKLNYLVIAFLISFFNILPLLINYVPDSIISYKLNYYMHGEKIYGWSFWSLLIMPLFFLYVKGKYVVENNIEYNYILNLYLYISVISLIFGFSVDVFNRISLYRFMIEPFLFTYIIYMVKDRLVFSLIIYFFVLSYYFFILSSDSIISTLSY